MSKEKDTKPKDNPAKDVSVASLPTKTTRQDENRLHINKTGNSSSYGKRVK